MQPTRFGRYEVQGKLGRGGFADVYLAFDPELARKVAVKVCRSDDEGLRRRFSHEARLVADLHHPNITTVFDLGVQDGVPYLVQEYLTGEDLSRLIERREPAPLATRLRWLVGIAQGLAFAHGRDIIHRDIKPSNIRILEDGRVKIMDFGIAKLMSVDHGLTADGMRVGTAGYLAPEQIQGTSVDQRADQFTFGALAYELLSYQRPFAGEEISAVLYKILQVEPPPLAERCPGCPPLVAGLVATCLQKDPSLRFRSFTELLPTLESQAERAAQPAPTRVWAETAVLQPTQVLPPPAPTAPTPSPTEASGFLTVIRGRRPLWALGGAAGLLVLALGVVALLRPVPEPRPASAPSLPTVEAPSSSQTSETPPSTLATPPSATAPPTATDPAPASPPVAVPSASPTAPVAPPPTLEPSLGEPSPPPPSQPARPRLFLRIVAGGGAGLEAAEQALLEEASAIEGVAVTFDALSPEEAGGQGEDAILAAGRANQATLAAEARLAWADAATAPRLTLRLRMWNVSTGEPLGQEDLAEALADHRQPTSAEPSQSPEAAPDPASDRAQSLGTALGRKGARALARSLERVLAGSPPG
jgi:eukaryotic-like serine/threonine-protein kinase